MVLSELKTLQMEQEMREKERRSLGVQLTEALDTVQHLHREGRHTYVTTRQGHRGLRTGLFWALLYVHVVKGRTLTLMLIEYVVLSVSHFG